MSKTPRGCFPLPGSDASPEFSPAREKNIRSYELPSYVKISSPSPDKVSRVACWVTDGTSALSVSLHIRITYFVRCIVTVLACHLRILLSATAGVGSSVEPTGRLLQLGQDRR